MRAFAVFMMIQGHTVSSLLNKDYVSSGFFFYDIWFAFRAFTAPLFIFVAGFIFTFLLYKNTSSLKANARVQKGIRRGISLIIMGYLLRYPTINIFNLSSVTFEQWKTFFAFDALHLIGTGILLILFFSFLSELLKINPLYMFILLFLSLFSLSPLITSIDFSNAKNVFFVSMISSKYNSLFPLFPYLQYVFLGAVLGKIITDNNEILNRRKFLLLIAVVGIALLLFPLIFSPVNRQSFFGVGVVLICFSVFGLIGRNISTLPKVVKSFAENSLWIYITHLVIIYGSPFSIGLFQIIGRKLNVWITLLSVMAMIILMILISLRIDKFKRRKLNYL